MTVAPDEKTNASGAPAEIARAPGPDGLRGLAACGVALHHLAYFAPTPSEGLLGLARSYFGLGVPLFFMISAFALTVRYEGRLAGARPLKRYAVRRAFRLYPLATLMLLVFLVSPYNPIPRDLPLVSQAGWALFYGSLLFSFFPAQAHGLVWASWSIGVEAAFYLVYPLVAWARPGVAALAATILAGHGLNLFLAARMAPDVSGLPWFWAVAPHLYIPFFAAGVLAARLMEPVRRAGTAGAHGLGGFFLASVIAALFLAQALGPPFDSQGKADPAAYPAVLLACAGPLFAALLAAVAFPPRWLAGRTATYLGDVSYSVYLVHPLVVFSLSPVVGALVGAFGATLGFVLAGALALACILPIATLTYRLVEKPGMALGRRLG